jgi:TPR repeat protein
MPWYVAGALAGVLAAAGGYRYLSMPVPATVGFGPGITAVGGNGSNEVEPSAIAKYRITHAGRGRQPNTTGVRSPTGTLAVTPANFDKALAELRARRPQEALPLFRQAAEEGEERAMVELGNLYEDGSGVPQDYSEAARWFRVAADRGNTTGMLRIGSMYYTGKGVPQNYALAAEWFRRASDSGDPRGEFDLGMMYERGHGVTKDPDAAEQFYRQSAKLGNEEAIKRLARISGGR